MFLQKYRNVNINTSNTTPTEKSFLKIIDAIKKCSAPQIKHHQRKQSYLDPRRHLIENTTKIIGLDRNNHSFQGRQAIREFNSMPNTQEIVKKQKKVMIDLGSRQGRITAAKNLRQKIWKSSDITALLRKQEQEHLRPRKIYNSHKQQYFLYDQQKINRYEDLNSQQKKKHQWLENSSKTNMNRSNVSNKNPQIQIKNIQFQEQQVKEHHAMNINSRLYTRQRRKQYKKMMLLLDISRMEKRPNTTGKINREAKNQDIIEPW